MESKVVLTVALYGGTSYLMYFHALDQKVFEANLKNCMT